jgi:hypothetical protein
MEAGLAHDRTQHRPIIVEWLTVERAAYGVIALAALALRLYNLGWRALGPDEAAQALAAWLASTGQSYDLAGLSPLLFLLQRAGFILFDGSEALARWWPALFGGLAALMFYPLRDRLTRGGALLAALLWALSPLMLFSARLGLGYGLTSPLALALAAGVNMLRKDGAGTRRFVLVAATLGLLLLAGSGAYTVLLWAALAAIIWRESLSEFVEMLRAQQRNILLAFGLVLVLGATVFLTELRGLAAAAELLGIWFRGLMPGTAHYTAWDILRRLLLGELLLLIFGVFGAVYAVRHRDRFGIFAGLAGALALLISLVGSGRHPADLSLVVLAFSLLAGPANARLLRQAWPLRTGADPWLLLGLSLALLTTSAICLPSAINTSNNLDWRQLYAGVGIATTVLTVAIWVVYGIWGSWRTMASIVPLVLLIFGHTWGIAQLSGLNYDRGAWRRPAVLVNMPANGLDDLVADLEELTALNGSGAREAELDLVLPVREDDPLAPTLRWALRDFLGLQVVRALPAEPASLVITEADEQPGLSDLYGGADYAVLQTWRPQELTDFGENLRWILYREAKTQGQTRNVVLWVDRSQP